MHDWERVHCGETFSEMSDKRLIAITRGDLRGVRL
jgi:hypothetical protein